MNLYIYIATLLGIAICGLIQRFSVKRISKIFDCTIVVLWSSFLATSLSWILAPSDDSSKIFAGFKTDPLRSFMVILILFISGIVAYFSKRYMDGDRNLKNYYINFHLLVFSNLCFVGSDFILSLGFFWTLNQITLSKLMIHKDDWIPAKESGKLFLKYSLVGSFMLWIGLILLSQEAGSYSIHQICTILSHKTTTAQSLALVLIILSALIQSGSWPFHKWLISSLNSPTTVSAFMHAGLVNGGGFLLALLSPLLISNSGLLQFLVIMGSISLALGSTWKLLQSNVKKMLACSTISQMGFMILQCGLGFFPSAVAHLCSHGLFKCFLFLNSGSVIQTPPRIAQNRHKISLPVASVCAFVGFICFSQIAGYSNSPHTGWILATFAGIGAMQASYAAIEKAPKFKLITGLLVSIGFSSLYAITYLKIESLVKPITMEEPQPLSIIHLASIFSIFLLFLIINFFPHYIENKTIWKKFYVKMVNWSQSHPTTITATRTDYQF